MTTRTNALKWPVTGRGETQGFGPYIQATPTKRQIRDAIRDGFLNVKDDEQRGVDPATGREMLNESKMKRWAEMEETGRLFHGQLNYSLHGEIGSTYELSADGKSIGITGQLLINDGRQRTYTIRHVVDSTEQYGSDAYDPDAPVEVTIWLDADSETRKEMYAQLNGGRGGDHASKSSVEWMAPEGPLQDAAKHLVATSRHLGSHNVNVKRDAVSRNDKRLAGHHTFVKALENAWGKRRTPTPAESRDLEMFLVRFYDRLVEVRPEMGVVDLGTRQKAREEFITAHPLFIYGAMRVAVDLLHNEGPDADLERLSTLAGAKGDEFLSLDNDMWKDIGVMLPVFDRATQQIKTYKVAMSLQTRRAMAQAVYDRFAEAG